MTITPIMRPLRALGLLLLMGAVACGGSGGDSGNGGSDAAPAGGNGAGELTAFEVEHGIGPITDVVVLGEVDPSQVEAGEAVFIAKCSACHKLDERYVGPPIGDVTTQRSATYIMNMILNPKEMYERHPEAKALLAEYLSFMPDQNVTPEEARAVVEYLRTTSPSGTE